MGVQSWARPCRRRGKKFSPGLENIPALRKRSKQKLLHEAGDPLSVVCRWLLTGRYSRVVSRDAINNPVSVATRAARCEERPRLAGVRGKRNASRLWSPARVLAPPSSLSGTLRRATERSLERHEDDCLDHARRPARRGHRRGSRVRHRTRLCRRPPGRHRAPTASVAGSSSGPEADRRGQRGQDHGPAAGVRVLQLPARRSPRASRFRVFRHTTNPHSLSSPGAPSTLANALDAPFFVQLAAKAFPPIWQIANLSYVLAPRSICREPRNFECAPLGAPSPRHGPRPLPFPKASSSLRSFLTSIRS